MSASSWQQEALPPLAEKGQAKEQRSAGSWDKGIDLWEKFNLRTECLNSASGKVSQGRVRLVFGRVAMWNFIRDSFKPAFIALSENLGSKV